jgi:transcription elongation factor GreA
MPVQIYVSEEGLRKLQGELADARRALETLKSEKNVAYTASGDTWHDNPYFNKLQQDEENLARRVLELQATISGAQLYSATVRNVARVRLGSIVRFYRRRSGCGDVTPETWEIVGFGETDVSRRKVAYNAPLAWDLLGLAPGELKDGEGADGPVEYEVVALYRSWEDVPPETVS